MDQRKTIEDLFIAAAELPREERSAWLNQACGGDEALRREVESLLTYDQGDSRLLSRVVQESAVLLMEGDAIPGLRIGPWGAAAWGPFTSLFEMMISLQNR